MVLQRLSADDHEEKARKAFSDSYGSSAESPHDIGALLLEANFHATMAVFEELRQMRREAGDAVPDALLDFLAGKTVLVHQDYLAELADLRGKYLAVQKRLKEAGDGRREAEEQLVRARDRQYLAEDKVARIREIVSGRDLKIQAHQSNREEQNDGTATMEADQGTGAPAHAHRGSSG